jgi:phytoene dehydrogenase-like protein
VGSTAPGDLLEQLRFVLKFRHGIDRRRVADLTKLFTMSAADLLSEWFESDEVKGALSTDGIIGTWAGPEEPGTAYVLMHHSVGDLGDGQISAWGYPEGGMGAVSGAIRRSAERFGATIRVGAPVDRVLVREGRALGAVIAGGEEFRAPLVITACHPKITFLSQVERHELPEEFVRDIENWKTRSGTVKINLAMSRVPEFRDDPGAGPEIQGASIMIAPTLRYLERAFEEARDRPGVDGTVLGNLHPERVRPDARARGHARDVDVHAGVPHTWNEEPHEKELEAYADRLFDIHEDFMPGFKDEPSWRGR